MNKLEKQRLIKKENLNPTHFFQSFLQEAHRFNLLTDFELNAIQQQSIQLLAKQAELYTKGESSSVKIETGQSIFQSILYSMSIYLKSLPNTDIAIEVLKEKPILELYLQGKELIEKQFERGKQLLYSIQNNCIVTDNYAYNDTLQKGLPIFFSAYDINFAAHDTPGSIDYPLSNDKMELVGIEYILSYLEKLSLENHFCKNFTDQEILHLLLGYDEHYQDLLINIFTLVLTNAIASLLANRNIYQLNIEPLDRQYLQQKLENLSKDQLDSLLQDASTQLCKAFNISDKLLKNHIQTTAINSSARIKNALDNNQLETLFISLKKESSQAVLQFQDGEKMNNELFKEIVDEIRECRYVSDKIAIIQKEIHSITDLMDVLKGYCIFEDEYDEIFQSLSYIELALLLNKLPTEEIDLNLHFTEGEKEWYNRLSCFFKKMDVTKRESIKSLSKRMTSDEF